MLLSHNIIFNFSYYMYLPKKVKNTFFNSLHRHSQNKIQNYQLKHIEKYAVYIRERRNGENITQNNFDINIYPIFRITT
ncbi:MAG: hypothetical protein CR982_00045 [Candidatus Cloacimonadota bacterium]|nr:MAG: hypothetical protein CR982_00045 [Candidatus Cloacimonadota bacterium]PIE78338.1 MAG: hypothetical protein CSA15_08355 [Candidatus Delongbacteria bacterium]